MIMIPAATMRGVRSDPARATTRPRPLVFGIGEVGTAFIDVSGRPRR